MTVRIPHFIRFADGEDDGKDGSKGGNPPADKDLGFPKDTPLVEMTEKQQLAYWKHHARRHEGVANSRADYDQQKADAEKWRQAQEEKKTPDQKAIDAAAQTAAENARREERLKTAPRIVRAEFKAAAAEEGVSKELLAAFLEDVNHAVYLNEDGSLNEEKVSKRVKALAASSGPKKQKRETTHQGFRPNDGATGVANGRSLFADRNKKKG